MKTATRAGLVLFNVTPGGDILFRCMIPSNPNYGGVQPQIPKGQIEPGDTPRYTAIKEAAEETGLRYPNLKYVKHFKYYEDTRLEIFIGEVFDLTNFNEPGWEALWSGWVNYRTERNRLRREQKHIFDDIAKFVSNHFVKDGTFHV